MKNYWKKGTFFVGTAVLILISSLLFFYQRQLPDIMQAKDQKNLVPVLIIGSGPAGLSAALYTARAGLPTTVLAGHNPGGQLADVRQIENWPGKQKASGADTMDDLFQQAKRFGAVIIPDNACLVNLSQWPFTIKTEHHQTLHALAVIIATGRIAKRLHVPGVETYWGKGIGTCTICDAPFHKNQIVGVVGGGDTAGDHALQLASYAQKVYMIVRDKELDASEAVQEYVKETKKIEILYNTEVVRADGNAQGLSKVTIKNNQTGKTQELPLRGLYFAIGYHPNSELVKKQIKTDAEGFIMLCGRTQKTTIPGIFAAGDVTDKRYGKAGVATGSGVKAGMDAIEFLQDIGFNQSKKELADNFYRYEAHKSKEIPCISSAEEFNQLIKNNKLVLVDFYSKFCPSCKTLLTYVQEAASQYEDKLKIVKVDTDVLTQITDEYQVSSVPYILIFKDGTVSERTGAIRTRQDVQKLIEKVLEIK